MKIKIVDLFNQIKYYSMIGQATRVSSQVRQIDTNCPIKKEWAIYAHSENENSYIVQILKLISLKY